MKRKWFTITVVIILIVILMGSIVKFIKINDAEYREDDYSSMPFVNFLYNSDISIDEEGNILTSKTAQELWDEMKKKGGRASEYLNNAKQLKKLMNAEIITQFPDTRPEEELDKKIDWKSKELVDPNSNKIQGIIKFKRGMQDGKVVDMIYASPSQLNSWIEAVNATGDEEAKKKALTHYTLEKASANSGFKGSWDGGNDAITDISERIVESANTTPPAGQDLCQAWVCRVYKNAGLGDISAYCAREAYNQWKVSDDRNNIPVGACVYGTGTGLGDGSGTYGHVGVYIGNGLVMDNVGNGVQTSSLNDWIAWQEACGVSYDGKVGWLGWGWNGGVTPTIIKSNKDSGKDKKDSSKDKKDSSKDNKNGNSTNTTTTNTETTNTTTTNSTADHDFVVKTDDTNSATVLTKEQLESGLKNWQSGKRLENALSVLDTIIECQEKYKVNAAFIYPILMWETQFGTDGSGTSAANNWMNIRPDLAPSFSTPNECIEEMISNLAESSYYFGGGNYTVYSIAQHYCDSFWGVTVGDTMAELYDACGITDYYAGNTNSSSTSKSSSGIGSASTVTKYCVKIATWNESYDRVTSNDSTVQQSESPRQYSMTTTKINYQDYVKPYTMQFNYLWAYLVITESPSFVLQLADLVYNSELELTFFDNVTEVMTTETTTYNRLKRITTNWDASVTYKDKKGNTGTVSNGGTDSSESIESYTTVHQNLKINNTIVQAITKANVWIVDYYQKYDYKASTNTTDNTRPYPDEEYSVSQGWTGGWDPAGIAQAGLAGVRGSVSAGSQIIGSSVDCRSQLEEAVRGKSMNTRIVTNKFEYILQPSEIKPKDDKKAEEDNFVKILSQAKNKGAKDSILSATNWLFEILELENNGTSDMVDLTKYLLYKVSGLDYGVKDFDFNTFKASDFIDASSGIFGGTIQEKVWFALLDLGYSKEVIAGAMGNIDYESGGFNADIIEGGSGEGIGLCQWSFERRTALEQYAASKGVGWQDEDTQVEFLVTEISGKGKATGFATKRTSGSIGDEGVTGTNEDWKNSNSIDSATLQFMRFFESPASKSSLDERIARAKKYYNEFKDKEKPTGGSIISIAKAIHDYMAKNRYTYCVSFCNGYEECSSISQCVLSTTFEKSKANHHVCCATYVSWVVQEAGYISEKEHTDSAGALQAILQNHGFKLISGNPQPGDILYYDGHIDIYAGNNTKYTAGCGPDIRTLEPVQQYAIPMKILRAP